MAKTEKKEKIVTPTGEARWCHVHSPKAPFTDERGQVKGEPKYQVDVVFDGKDPAWKKWAGELMQRVRELPKQIDKKTKKEIPKQNPLKPEFDENDKETGRWYVTFKTGEKFKPGVFDRYGQPIPETVLIGNGSKIKVNYTPKDYEGFGGGVSLYLNAIQVLELVEYKPQTADAYGFESEEPPAEFPGDETEKPSEPESDFRM